MITLPYARTFVSFAHNFRFIIGKKAVCAHRIGFFLVKN